MIPFIRSLTELMVMTKSRDELNKRNEIKGSRIYTEESGQRKRYLRSESEIEIDLPNIPKSNRRKWIKNKEAVYKFFDKLDYNNQIQSSFDLTLLDRQNRSNNHDAA